jgi:hypothetical protein
VRAEAKLRRQVRQLERPEPSVIWQTLAVTFCTFAFAAVLAAVTLSGHVAVRSVDLWIAAGGFALAAALCFAAHRDVNRGRRSKLIEVEERPINGEDGWKNRRAG